MKKFLQRSLVFAVSLCFIGLSNVHAVDAFKGESPSTDIMASAQIGMGLVNSSPGFALIGGFSKKIINRGFVDDINNQVFIELQLGPIFTSSSTPFAYSAHLRWDFIKDSEWTLFAVGGLGGHILTSADQWMMFPRTGLGARYTVNEKFSIRADVSHEFSVLGASFNL